MFLLNNMLKMEQDKSNAHEIVTELSDEGELKLEIIQSLLEPCDRDTYGQRLKDAAKKLGKSVRTVQRLVKQWEKEGLAGLAPVRGLTKVSIESLKSGRTLLSKPTERAIRAVSG
jgi:transposase-like protein